MARPGGWDTITRMQTSDTPSAAVPAPVPASADTGTSGETGETRRFRLGNRPPLTGVRALGVTAVLVYHSNFHTMPGAWAMLQVFFVLSGFLITAMLSGEWQRNGTISVRNFYARRAVRLLPPLLLTVGLLAVYGALVHVADASQRLWGDSAATLFYYADYRQALGHAPFFGYLAQSWSLAVEEQFYIIWSVLLMVAVALHRKKLAYGFAIVGVAASLADRLYLALEPSHFTNVTFTRIYYAFDSRADAMFLGCLLGLLASDGFLSNWPRWLVNLESAAALLATGFMGWILFTSHLFTENVATWWLPLTTVACALIIVHFVVAPKSWASAFVGLGVFVFVGDLSYTIYLVHFPVYLALEPGQYGTHWGYWPTELLRLAVIFGIAVASWYAMERPLMRWRARSAAR